MAITSPDHPPPQRLPRNVKLLGWASLLNDVASEMIFPLLPQFLITVLGGTKFQLGAIEGFADSVGSLVKLWSGGRSDRGGGRKKYVVAGYALAAVVRPLCGLIMLPWQLFGIRIVDRFGKGIRTSPRDALIADSTPSEIRGRAFGFHRGMDHLGAAIGPLLAAAFLFYWPGALREMFLLTVAPGALVIVLLIFGLHDPRKLKSSTQAPSLQQHGVGEQPKSRITPGTLTLRPFGRGFRIYLLALVVFTLGNSSDAFLLVRAGELGVATWLLPILWCVFHVVKSAGNMLGGRLADRWGSRPMILGGWIYYAGIYLAFAMASSAWQVWALFIAYAIFYALTEPAEKALVANLVGEEHRGLAYGWYNCAMGIATLPASLIFGALYQTYGPLAAFGSGAVLAAIAAILLTQAGASSEARA
jgi:MFS family permease